MKNTPKTRDKEILRLFHSYIKSKGFGPPRESLTISISPDVFKRCYYNKDQLKMFCQQYGISTVGSKDDLSRRIEYFLRTGNIKKDSKKAHHGKADSEQGIMLNTQVVHYKSDSKTRMFMKNHMPRFTGFSAWVQNKIRERLANGDVFTYADVIQMHLGFLLQKDRAKATGEKMKVAHDSCQYNQFAIDYKNDPNTKPHTLMDAWKLVRDTVGDQTYQRYKNRVNEIFTLIEKMD